MEQARAKYGEKVIEDLSARLTERNGAGFSERNLQWFRQFHLAYKERIAIPYPLGTESSESAILHQAGGESSSPARTHKRFSRTSPRRELRKMMK
ncbi:MAG: DUF1016 N-terminal domain-containing protein [Candidatus Zhuqueibacterota bacterium]